MKLILQNVKMFQNIPGKELHETFKQIHFQIRTYEEGQYVFNRNTKCEDLLILLSGIIKAELRNFNDITVKIAEIKAPDCLAAAFLFGENNLFPVDAMAATDVKILRIPKQEVLKMLQINPIFLENFINRISTRAQYLTNKLKFLSFQTIKGKLAFYIVNNSSEKQSNEFKINKTQNELAEIFGVTRPSLARTIKQLVDEGLISFSAKTVKIINKKGLGKYLKYEDQLHK